MSEVFEVEIGGKTQKINMRKPTLRQIENYRNEVFPYIKLASQLRGLGDKELSDDQIKTAKEALVAISLSRKRLVLELCPEIKKDEIDDMAGDDFERIMTWIDNKMGGDKNFLPK